MANVAHKANCDSTRVDCQYSWIGIPNRAFALIATGVPNAVPGTTPFGRLMTARFYFETIRRSDESAQQLASADRFLNQRNKLLSVCDNAIGVMNVMHASNRWRDGRVITRDDCANVARAFEEVGVAGVRRSGFDKYDVGLGVGGVRTEHAGGRLGNDCAISGHRLFVEVTRSTDVLPFQLSRSDRDSPPLDINHLNGELTAKVVKRCGGTADMSLCPDPADREVRYEYSAKWDAVARFVYVDEDVEPAAWMNGEESYCYARTQDGELSVYQSTPISRLVSGFIFGNTTSIQLTPNSSNPTYVVAPCVLDEIGVVDEHRTTGGTLVWRPLDPRIELPHRAVVTTDYPHESHGLYASYSGLNYRDYSSSLSLWADAFSAVFGRVVYVVYGPKGFSCSFQSPTGRGVAPMPSREP